MKHGYYRIKEDFNDPTGDIATLFWLTGDQANALTSQTQLTSEAVKN